MAWSKLLGMGVLCFLVLVLLAGCPVAAGRQPAGGSADPKAAEAPQGDDTPDPLVVEQRVATRGEEFEIRLEGNVTTGYSWQVVEIDEKAVHRVSEDYVESKQGDQQVVGSGGTFVFRFKALAQGQTKVKIVYQRPWEKDVEPLRSYTLELTVR